MKTATNPHAVDQSGVDQSGTDQSATQTARTCDPRTRATKSLLAYGVVAGPFFVVTALAQALTREGFDLTRHEWSLLANGPLGWIQIADFILSGAMTIAFAVGLRRAIRPGRGAIWAPRLFAMYGLGLIGAGIFRADPRLGFPVGAPNGPGVVSWHGTLHFVTAGIGFLGLIAACFVMASRFITEGRRGWAGCSRLTGIVFVAAFVGVASGQGSVPINLAFTFAIIAAWTWMSAVAVDRYRGVARRS
jgi:hypothetical membrane protein